MMISSLSSTNSFYSLTKSQSTKPDPSQKFTELDSDGNGSLSKTEFESLVTEISGNKSIDSEKLLSEIDSDGDGLISSEEFLAAKPPEPKPGGFDRTMIQGEEGAAPPPPPPPSRAGGSSEEDEESSELSLFFDELDVNQDGVVDASELLALSEKISNEDGTNVSAGDLLSALDTDEDDALSFEELFAKKKEAQNSVSFKPNSLLRSNSVSSYNSNSMANLNDLLSSLSNGDDEIADAASKLLELLKENNDINANNLSNNSKKSLSYNFKYAMDAYNKFTQPDKESVS